MRNRCLVFLVSMMPMLGVMAQQKVSGRIYSGINDSLLAGVSVYNKKAGAHVFSGSNGEFSIAAHEGDSILFSAIGYEPDTTIVQYHMLLVPVDITLAPRATILEEVEVTSNYSADSLARRNAYQSIYDQPDIRGRNRPPDGFGISVSPFTHFSKEAKQKRDLRKRLVKDEEEAFVDYSFPEGWVSSLTGLRGDSLKLFMIQYRPSYAFCRNATRVDMLIYVNDRLKEFKKAKMIK